MNLMVTIDINYITQLIAMLKSIEKSNSETNFYVYVVHKSLTSEDFQIIKNNINKKYINIISIRVNDDLLKNAPVTYRYPTEMYYRIFASKFLPEDMDRILYLDPDIVVINSLYELYNMDFEDNYYIGASHIGKVITKFNEYRLDMEDESVYINSGVLLMNLKLLRENQDINDVFNYIEKYRNRLFLPDQDILSALYGNKIKTVKSEIYNLSERMLVLHNLKIENKDNKIDIEWVRKNTVIVHYCGRNKPWKENYIGMLDCFYDEVRI